MTELRDLEPPTEAKNRIVQMALRETDTAVLAQAAVAMDSEEREIIFRNLSKRAFSVFVEEVARAEGAVSEAAAREAKEFFLNKIKRYYEVVGMRTEVASDGETPILDTSGDEEIVQSFVNAVRFVREHGILALEPTKVVSDFALTEKGLRMVIDGWDPALMNEILERMKASYLSQITRRLDMIVEGFESLVSEDLPQVVEARLRAYSS